MVRFWLLRHQPHVTAKRTCAMPDLQQIIRWIVIAIVLLVAIVILNALLQVADFLLGFALKGLIVLFIVALILRFISVLAQKRR